jgi:hypothetical protein
MTLVTSILSVINQICPALIDLSLPDASPSQRDTRHSSDQLVENYCIVSEPFIGLHVDTFDPPSDRKTQPFHLTV